MKVFQWYQLRRLKSKNSSLLAGALKSGSLHQLNSRVWAFSSAWLERFPDKEEVSGSSPLRPTNCDEITRFTIFTDLISEQSLDKVAPLTR